MTKDELIRFICDDAGIDAAEINEDTPLFTEGYIDSFTMTSMIAFIEEKMGFEIEQSAVTLDNFDTVSRIMAYVENANR